jgi:hypothetical protein
MDDIPLRGRPRTAHGPFLHPTRAGKESPSVKSVVLHDFVVLHAARKEFEPSRGPNPVPLNARFAEGHLRIIEKLYSHK